MRQACTHCQREYVPHQSGVLVIEFASFGPYKVWMADELKCPECAHTILAGFPNGAVSEHFMPDFQEIIQARYASDPSSIRLVFESWDQREWYRGNLIFQPVGVHFEPRFTLGGIRTTSPLP